MDSTAAAEKFVAEIENKLERSKRQLNPNTMFSHMLSGPKDDFKLSKFAKEHLESLTSANVEQVRNMLKAFDASVSTSL